MLDAKVKIKLFHMPNWDGGKLHIMPTVEVDYSKVKENLSYHSRQVNNRDPASDWERNEARLLNQVTRFESVFKLHVAMSLKSALVDHGMIQRRQWWQDPRPESAFSIDKRHEEVFRNNVMLQFELEVLDLMKRALRFAGKESNKAFVEELEVRYWMSESQNTPREDPMYSDEHRKKVAFPRRIKSTYVEWGPLGTSVENTYMPLFVDTVWLYAASALVTLEAPTKPRGL